MLHTYDFFSVHFRWAIMKIPLKNSGSCTTSWSRILCRRYYNLTVSGSFCFSSTPFYSILPSSEIIWTCWIDTRQCTLWRGFWDWLKSLWSSTSIGYVNLPYLYSFLGASIFQHFGTNPLSFAFTSTFAGIFFGLLFIATRQTIAPLPFDQSLDTWFCVPCDQPQIMAVNLTLPPSSGFPLALTETIKQNAMRTLFATFRFLSNPNNSGGK